MLIEIFDQISITYSYAKMHAHQTTKCIIHIITLVKNSVASIIRANGTAKIAATEGLCADFFYAKALDAISLRSIYQKTAKPIAASARLAGINDRLVA